MTTAPDKATAARLAAIEDAVKRLNIYDAASPSSDEDEWADLVFRLLEVVKQQRTTVVDAQRMLAAQPNDAAAVEHPETDDTNVTAVRAKLLKRSRLGLSKYGVTTDRAGLTPEQWLAHLQEELMDGAVYIEAALARKP